MTIRIGKDLKIPEHEVSYRFSRSSKPGGQNVNKISSRVTLRFDVGRSASLSETQRNRIREHLASRMTKDGILAVVSQKHRTQRANREEALWRFTELLNDALRPTRRRKPTAVPREVKESRLRAKRRRGLIKRERTRPPVPDD